MRNYRVTGARREDGSRVDEILLADSVDDAVSRANALGVLVSEARVVEEATAPMYTRRRRAREALGQRERAVVRLVARIGAFVMMAPGALLLVISLVGALVNLLQTASRGGIWELTESLVYNAAGVFGATAGAAVMMTIGALVLVVLMIEEWLFLMERKG